MVTSSLPLCNGTQWEQAKSFQSNTIHKVAVIQLRKKDLNMHLTSQRYYTHEHSIKHVENVLVKKNPLRLTAKWLRRNNPTHIFLLPTKPRLETPAGRINRGVKTDDPRIFWPQGSGGKVSFAPYQWFHGLRPFFLQFKYCLCQFISMSEIRLQVGKGSSCIGGELCPTILCLP